MSNRFIAIAFVAVIVVPLFTLNAGPSITGSPLFRVEHIAFEGLSLLDPDEISVLSGISAETNLYEVDLNKVVSRIETHPMVRNARIVRYPPDGVLITIVERTPIALVNLEVLCGIDEEGILLPFYSTFVDLPVITGVQLGGNYTLGRAVSEPELLSCLDLLNETRGDAPELWDQISEVRPGQDMVRINLVGDGLEVRMNPWDVLSQAEKLRAWSDAAGWAELPDFIDLRFDGQVIVRRTKKGS